MCHNVTQNADAKMEEYFEYLDQLRESGVTNMFGAVPYLQAEFPELSSDRARASQVLQLWMQGRRGQEEQ